MIFRMLYVNLPVGVELYDSDGYLIDLNAKDMDIFGIRFDSYRKRGKECSHVCAERVRGEWISE